MNNHLPSFFIHILVFFTVLQFLFPWSRNPNRWSRNQFSVWATNILLIIVIVAFSYATHISLYLLFTGHGISGIPGVQEWPSALRILVALLIGDFLGSFVHAIYHRVPFLWKLHRIHHLDKHVDTLTAIKMHPFEVIVASACGFLGVYATELSIPEILIVRNTTSFFTVFVHSDWRLPYWMERIMGTLVFTSGHHLIHHDIDEGKAGKNFGIIFSFWDRLVGTYMPAEKGARYEYGVRGFSDVDNGFLRILSLRLKPEVEKKQELTEQPIPQKISQAK